MVFIKNEQFLDFRGKNAENLEGRAIEHKGIYQRISKERVAKQIQAQLDRFV
ncbi:hypothetical protein OAM49_00015 [bacterium]|nr:hypothetical protein [bacterium]